MVSWIILFLLIVAISFVLAVRSMKDYQEIPQQSKLEYGLFLVRRIGNFNANFLNSLLEVVSSENLVVSIERLFKGQETVLTIFGPKTLLDQFSKELDLLELEDYAANLDSNVVSIWELGVKDSKKFNPENVDSIFNNLPALDLHDQFFWQVLLGNKQAQIRAAFYPKDLQKHHTLTPVLHGIKLGGFVKVPRPFSKEQMINFYKLRSLDKSSMAPVLAPETVMRLLKVS